MALLSKAVRNGPWRHLGIGHQHLKDGFVALVQERQDVWHITVLSQPICRFHNVSGSISDNACRFYHACFWVNGLVVVHLMAIGIVWPLLVVAEEIDASSQEVDGRSLEELVAAATTFLLSLL